MTTNPLWAMIQRYMDDPRHRYPPKPADLARECDLSPQLLSKWKKRPTLPEPDQLAKLSRGTGIDYPRLLEAALAGKGYFIAGPARIVTADYLEAADEEDFAVESKEMPWMRPVSNLPFDIPESAAARRSKKHPPRGTREQRPD